MKMNRVIKQPGHGWWKWIAAGFLAVVVGLMTLFWFWSKLPPEMPWLYSLPWGEEQLISKVWFAFGLGSVMIGLGLCAWLAKMLADKDVRASVLLARGGFIVSVLYLLSFFQVLRLMLGI